MYPYGLFGLKKKLERESFLPYRTEPRKTYCCETYNLGVNLGWGLLFDVIK